MVAEDKSARSLPKNKDLSIQHHLDFLQRLRGVTHNQGDDQRCPFQGRTIGHRKMPNHQGPHRANTEELDTDPLMSGEMEEAEQELESSDTEEEESDQLEQLPTQIRRHIHPCVCDLTKSQRKRIKAHLDQRALMRRKYNARIREIEEELARLEEERVEREREMEEQQELFGDEYELVGKKKKRKKRSARRASMVSLGVKQVINWRKEPKIKVKMTKASSLRKEYASYCGRRPIPTTPWKRVSYEEQAAIQVRVTKTFTLRLQSNKSKLEYLLAQEDKKKRFELPYWV